MASCGGLAPVVLSLVVLAVAAFPVVPAAACIPPANGSPSSVAWAVEWLMGGRQANRYPRGEDPDWTAAVETLEELWKEPRRRPVVLRLLRDFLGLTSRQR
jgi:hypothetical protein